MDKTVVEQTEANLLFSRSEREPLLFLSFVNLGLNTYRIRGKGK